MTISVEKYMIDFVMGVVFGMAGATLTIYLTGGFKK